LARGQEFPSSSPHGAAPADSVASRSAARPLPVADSLFGLFRGSGEPVEWADLVSEAAGVRIVLIGESHDDQVAHRLQLRLLEDLFAMRRGELVLSLEAFERDVQLVLDEYLSGLITDDYFRKSSRPWGNYESGYASLVEFARVHRLPVIAANAPRRYVNRVARLGPGSLEDLPESAREWLPPLPLDGPSDAYRDKWNTWLAEAIEEAAEHHAGEKAFTTQAMTGLEPADTLSTSAAAHDDSSNGMEGTHGRPEPITDEAFRHAGEEQDPESPHTAGLVTGESGTLVTPHAMAGSSEVHGQSEEPGDSENGAGSFLLDAQSTWDATMSYSIAGALEQFTASTVLHIVGGFHVSEGLGIPEHLQRFVPTATTLIVLMEPTSHTDDFDAAEVQGAADFVILTKDVDAPGRE
jgi:uncharacterized iron-regulated protein